MRKLSEKDRTLVRLLEVRADLPLTELMRETGYRRDTIRYRLQSLADHGVIQHPIPIVNVYRLGFSEFTLYVSMRSRNEQARSALWRYLIDCPRVPYIASLGAEYTCMISIYGRSVQEALEEQRRIASSLGSTILAKATTVRSALYFFGRKYLAHADRKVRPLVMSDELPPVELDDADRKVLSMIADARGRTSSELAAAAGIPASTFTRRRRALEASGVISGYLLPFISERAGFCKYKLLLHVRTPTQGLREKIYRYSEEHPNVVYLVECFGEWDFEIGVEVESREAVMGIREELLLGLQKYLSDIRTIPVFDYLKFEPYSLGLAERSEAVPSDAGRRSVAC